jgi:hypothetical protein
MEPNYKRWAERAEGKRFASGTGGGEGSRGGVVIGHTQSGKPVYASEKANANPIKHANASSKGYTQQDHQDAATTHLQKAEEASKKGDTAGAQLHKDIAQAHAALGKTAKEAHADARQVERDPSASHADKAKAFRAAQNSYYAEGKPLAALGLGGVAELHERKAGQEEQRAHEAKIATRNREILADPKAGTWARLKARIGLPE